MKNRFKNPLFILALSSFVYQILAQANIQIDEGLFKQAVDLITYGFIGFGVYSTFGQADTEKKPEDQEV